MKQDKKFRRELKSFKKQIIQINTRRRELNTAPDRQLKKLSANLKQQARDGAPLDGLLAEAFAVTCEAARRTLGLDPFDVQTAAGIAMHQGRLAEMQTGEGKTLAAVLPAYLNALTGDGVHVLTFNDYLAKRDAEWMGPIYRFLGLSVGHVREGMTAEERQAAYAADITYVTAREAGFDFLRGNRCREARELVHRPFHFAIVDEADSILIDEARIPLVIAGETPAPRVDPYELAGLVRDFKAGDDYYFDEYSRDVNFTDAGLDRLEHHFQCGSLHDPDNNQLLAALNLALQAELLLHRDVDYIVRENRVELVDAFTGRVADKRRWPYGLQAAVEAKENIEIQPDGMILGSITLQHFLGLYPGLAGMTATAKTSEEELDTFYGLKVTVIPPNRTCIRMDRPDAVFTHWEAKINALVQEIRTVHAVGRPILVGTASVEESERISTALGKARGAQPPFIGAKPPVGVKVLNAKNDAAEAAIIAEAGALNAVTISTNMAGRGTDIRLGGKDGKTYERVKALGGLYVIGTNRHESRRIDRQLRGRAGRQGDPGSSRFFISMEDDLMVRYKLGDLIPASQLPVRQDAPIDSPVVAREIARAQRIIEGQNFAIRKTLRNYSFIVEEQRKLLHGKRRDVLEGGAHHGRVLLSKSFAGSRGGFLKEPLAAGGAGSTVLERVVREISLYHIDKAWTDHLAYIAHIREGIHLLGYGGKVPSVEFGKMAIEAFDELQHQLDEDIMATLNRVKITENGIDMEAEGLDAPSSTWTYLVDDNPFDNPLKSAIMSSNTLALGAAFAMLPYLPFILIGRLFRRFFKKPS